MGGEICPMNRDTIPEPYITGGYDSMFLSLSAETSRCVSLRFNKIKDYEHLQPVRMAYSMLGLRYSR